MSLELTTDQVAALEARITELEAKLAEFQSPISAWDIDAAFVGQGVALKAGIGFVITKEADTGRLILTPSSGSSSGASLADADGDTQIQVEESADEDKIRMDTGGTERVVLDENAWALDTVPVQLTEISTPSNPSQNDALLFLEADGTMIVYYMLTATGQKIEIARGLDATPTPGTRLLTLGVKA